MTDEMFTATILVLLLIMDEKFSKIIVIVGPTASGKTELGIWLAKKFNGEIISADSRQIYRQMTIGTAKPPGSWRKIDGESVYMVEGVPHFGLDILDPKDEFSLADWQELCAVWIKQILKRNHLPIVVGGTGLYLWSIIDNLSIPPVAPNKKLRRSLSAKPLSELTILLREIDPETMKKIDLRNPRRVLRALEVAILTGQSFFEQRHKSPPLYSILQLGVNYSREELYARIDSRVDEQIKDGLVTETESLMKKKYPWNLPSMSSLGYRQIGEYLRGETPLAEAVVKLKQATRHYARRQLTWFKRDKRIIWLNGPDKAAAEKLVKEFLK